MDRQHLKILESMSQISRSYRVGASSADWQIYKELWQAGCFEGLDHRDRRDGLDFIEIDGLSAHGRETHHELRSVWTSIGLLKKNRWKVYAWFFGIIAAVFAGVIVYLLTRA